MTIIDTRSKKLKTEQLVTHFKALLAESQKHIAYTEMMHQSKQGCESQIEYLIERFEGCIAEIDRQELIDWMKALLISSTSQKAYTDEEHEYKISGEAVLETFIEELVDGEEYDVPVIDDPITAHLRSEF